MTLKIKPLDIAEHLTKPLAVGGNPNFVTVSRVAKALGCKLQVA